jgi:Ni,Fe-hydrogenase III large subunit
MIKDSPLADMTLALASIDPCFSCTDRLETVDINTGKIKTYTAKELEKLLQK